MVPKMSIFSRQDSRVLVFREESSAKQRDLCNLASQYSEPDDYAVTLSLVCGKREEFRPDEGRPRDGFCRVPQLHCASGRRPHFVRFDRRQLHEEFFAGRALILR